MAPGLIKRNDSKAPQTRDEWIEYGRLLSQNPGRTSKEKNEWLIREGLDYVKNKVERSNAIWLYKMVSDGVDFSGCNAHGPTYIRKWFRLEHAADSGEKSVVYVLSNPYMPGMVKIGLTEGNINRRMGELNRSTSIPTDFNLDLCVSFASKDLSAVELALHQAFGSYRVNRYREFFRVTPEMCAHALKMIKEHIATRDNVSFSKKFLEKVCRETEILAPKGEEHVLSAELADEDEQQSEPELPLDEPYVAIEKLSERVSVSTSTIRSWLRQGYIKSSSYLKVGNTYRFLASDVISDLQQLSAGHTDSEIADQPMPSLSLQQSADNKTVSSEMPNGNGRLIYADGNVYVGNLVDGKPHGKGKLTYVEKALYFDYVDFEDIKIIYEGEFFDGKPHGKGTLINELEGQIFYDGDFFAGKPHGRGQLFYANWDTYNGDFFDGKQHGKGELTYGGKDDEGTRKEGDVYSGDFLDGEPHGKGELESSSIDGVISGDFAWGRITFGKINYADGRVYLGNLSDNKPYGVGELTYPDGSIYKGEFEGRPYGVGELTYPDGSIYSGEFDNGPDGKGKYTSISGYIYEGDIWPDSQVLKGKHTYANGDVYEGNFNGSGMREGKGKLTYANGDVYEGEFTKGYRDAKGKLTYANGDVYEGEFAFNVPHGEGKFTDAFGGVYEVNFFEGHLDNKRMIRNKDAL